MRYFPILVWVGRLQQRGAALPKTWDPKALRFEEQPTVDDILAIMRTDRKVGSVEELDAAVKASLGDQISRVLWIPEELLEDVRRRVLRQLS